MLRRGQGAARDSQRSSTSDVSSKHARCDNVALALATSSAGRRTPVQLIDNDPVLPHWTCDSHHVQRSAAGGRASLDRRSADAGARSDVDAALDALNTVPLLSSVSQVTQRARCLLGLQIAVPREPSQAVANPSPARTGCCSCRHTVIKQCDSAAVDELFHRALRTSDGSRDRVAAQADLYRAAEAAARAAEVFGPGDLIAVDGSAMERLFIVREGSCCEIEVRARSTAWPHFADAHGPYAPLHGGRTEHI
jgi:hypothetical protein